MGKFFAELGKDYQPTGRITDEGVFIPCEPFEHDDIAKEKTGLSIPEVEKIWIRISLWTGINQMQFCGDRMTKKQHKALDDWGLNELLEKRRLNATEQFIEAYFK